MTENSKAKRKMVVEKAQYKPLDMEGEGIPEAHVQGIDMAYRAPDLTPDQRNALPEPILDARPDWIALYWRAWAISFDKVRTPVPESGLVRFVDEGFSDNIFQWDTCFMLGFLRYATHILPVYGTLDNFYLKQHDDGFICREISEITGKDFWPRDHLSAINPPLFADSEWLLYEMTANKARLKKVLPSLEKYYYWLRQNRRHEDGVGYWTTALASGMDNTPRPFAQGGADVHKSYGYVWLCMTAQQAHSAQRLSQICNAIGERKKAEYFDDEANLLASYINDQLWNESLGLYVDRMPDKQVASVKTPASFWPLLLNSFPSDRVDRIKDAIFDPAVFWTPHAIPSVSADHPVYFPRGNYWQGSVWPPLVHLAVRAMDNAGDLQSAQRISENHLNNVSEVFKRTGTLWENYMPESMSRGNISRPEFAGWTACGPIAELLEVIIGTVACAYEQSVTWRMTRSDRHGVRNLRVAENVLSLVFEPVSNTISVESEKDFTLYVLREGRQIEFSLSPGKQVLNLS